MTQSRSRRSMLTGALAASTALAAVRAAAQPASATNRVYQIGAQKDFNSLTLVTRPTPVPGPGEALIRVHYAGVAARDQGILIGLFPVPPGPRPETRIPLSEGGGEVLAVGSGEARIKPGDRVTSTHWARWISGPWSPANYAADVGNTVDGWLGEHIILPTSGLAKLPDAVSTRDAATLAGSGVTAWHALHEVARVRSDDTVLSLGTGGVSTFGLLFAKAAGARVIVTSSSNRKLARMKELGADDGINYRDTPDWGKAVMDLTGGRGASVILENVGPATLDQSMAAAGNNARIVMIGTGRPPPNPPNMNGMYLRNLMLKAISAGSRTMVEDMLAAMANARISPVIAKEIPFERALDAYNEIRGGDHVGKIVIKIA